MSDWTGEFAERFTITTRWARARLPYVPSGMDHEDLVANAFMTLWTRNLVPSARLLQKVILDEWKICVRSSANETKRIRDFAVRTAPTDCGPEGASWLVSRKFVCGHLRNGINTYSTVRKDGIKAERCKECRKITERRYRQRKKELAAA